MAPYAVRPGGSEAAAPDGIGLLSDLPSAGQVPGPIPPRYRFGRMVSRSRRMQEVFRLLPLVARSDSPVLVVGASGTGKELVARAIHDGGPRRDSPFVAVSCAAMPETLLESELFGYLRGAFTDAVRDRPGRIAQADGGTLFLDEIGDLAPGVQVKLLRFLQEMVYEPLGATYSTRADVRIVSATNRDLAHLVQRGAFRADLYFRLNVVRVRLPRLAERREDIPLLVRHFLDRFGRMFGRRVDSLHPRALALLMDHPFPGNVRELENVIEGAVLFCRGSTIQVEHLPEHVRAAARERPSSPATAERSPPRRTPPSGTGDERRRLVQALAGAGGNRTAAAATLGMHRGTLLRKMKRYGIV